MGALPNPPQVESNRSVSSFAAWSIHSDFKSPSCGRNDSHLLQIRRDALRVRIQIILSRPVDFGQPQEHVLKTGPPPLVMRRKIRATEERPQIRKQKNAHGPTALARHHLHRFHVNAVDIRALFPIHLDGDEMLIQDFGDSLVPRSFHAPSHGTNGMRNNRRTRKWACFLPLTCGAHPLPKGTTAPGCIDAARDTGSSPVRGGSSPGTDS